MLVFVAMLSGVTRSVLRGNLKFVDVVSGEQHPLNLSLIEVWKNLSAWNELGMAYHDNFMTLIFDSCSYIIFMRQKGFLQLPFGTVRTSVILFNETPTPSYI